MKEGRADPLSLSFSPPAGHRPLRAVRRGAPREAAGFLRGADAEPGPHGARRDARGGGEGQDAAQGRVGRWSSVPSIIIMMMMMMHASSYSRPAPLMRINEWMEHIKTVHAPDAAGRLRARVRGHRPADAHLRYVGKHLHLFTHEHARTSVSSIGSLRLPPLHRVHTFIHPSISLLVAAGRRMTPAEIFARIEAVEVEDIKATALAYIVDEDHALAAIGPVDALPPYDWIRRQAL